MLELIRLFLLLTLMGMKAAFWRDWVEERAKSHPEAWDALWLRLLQAPNDTVKAPQQPQVEPKRSGDARRSIGRAKGRRRDGDDAAQ